MFGIILVRLLWWEDKPICRFPRKSHSLLDKDFTIFYSYQYCTSVYFTTVLTTRFHIILPSSTRLAPILEQSKNTESKTQSEWSCLMCFKSHSPYGGSFVYTIHCFLFWKAKWHWCTFWCCYCFYCRSPGFFGGPRHWFGDLLWEICWYPGVKFIWAPYTGSI